MNEHSGHDEGHLALFRYGEKFILLVGVLGAAKHPHWNSEAEKILKLSRIGEAAAIRAMSSPGDAKAETEMRSTADAFTDITEKYVHFLPEREKREYFLMLNAADLESEHEPFDS